MSNGSIRQRTAVAKHGNGSEPPVHVPTHDSDRNGINAIAIRQQAKLHTGVWARITVIVGLFTILVLFISRKGSRPTETTSIVTSSGSSGSARVGKPKSSDRDEKPLFVTIVMPSVVRPENRPLRLSNIAQTWGQSSRAIYVVHGTDEYPQGDLIDDSSKSTAYPQNLVIPDHITVEKGVERLEYVIRTLHKEINPDFAFFVNDHTFVLPEHLCQFLKEHDSSHDLYAGHALKGQKETAFNSGAAGYVVSRTTLERLIKEWENPDSKCSAASVSKWLQGNPGLLTAKCFGEVLNIPLVDTRDQTEGFAHTFHAYGLIRTVTGKLDDWYLKKHEQLDSIFGNEYGRLQNGNKCCSTQSVSFHYVEAAESLAFWEIMQTIHKLPSMPDEEIKELMNKIWPRDKVGLGFYAHALPGPHLEVWNDVIRVVRKISGGVAPPSC